LVGGAGNDYYYVDSALDVVTELSGEGTDTVQSSVTYTLSAEVENLTLSGTGAISATGNSLGNYLTGNSGGNTLTGAAGNDTLNGSAGADTLVGGAGNDFYYVDSALDVVTELSGEGTDTVNTFASYTLSSEVENLTLSGTGGISGTGNLLSNYLTGNSGGNRLTGLAGNDTLNGGAGADTLVGGAGNDYYFVDSALDVVTELSGEGTDTVQSSVTYTLSAEVENLTLTGSSAITGTGNVLSNVLGGNSGANVLTGFAGNDTLNGGAGADTLVGGAGNDFYYVDSALDVVTELSGEGTDTVQSSVTYTLSAEVENLLLSGSSAINGTGNELANSLSGNNGANTLTGAAGNDTLSGGAGADMLVGGAGNDRLNGGLDADTFVFTDALGSTNVDTILDFNVADDTIQLSTAIFTTAGGAGALAAGAFNTGSAATEADDRIIYNSATGALLYDSDGVGGAAAVQFATLTSATGALTAADFVIG
jgi:Ca2+-binding RTX toxin-like protein